MFFFYYNCQQFNFVINLYSNKLIDFNAYFESFYKGLILGPC